MRARSNDFFSDARAAFGLIRFDTIFDVGANVGQSAHIFAAENPGAKIYCFEPVVRAYNELKRNVEHLPNVETYQLAMGDRRYIGHMHVGAETSLASFETKSGATEVEDVAVMTLDGFAENSGIWDIDLLKIDTEGHDLKVLAGARNLILEDRIKFIQVEASFYADNPRFVSLSTLISALERYEVFGIYDQMPHPTGRQSVAYLNAVFVNRQLLKEPAWR